VEQLLDVINRPYLAPLIAPLHVDTAEDVSIVQRVVACRDPGDDKSLELAINGLADFIVSGDADLLTLHPFRGIPIIPPATFVQGATR
jgi:uncharacterized protein